MYKISIGENSYEVVPNSQNAATGTLNGADYTLDISGDHRAYSIEHNDKSYRVFVIDADYESKSFTIRVNNQEYTLEAKDRFDLLLEKLGLENLAASAVSDLKAPMPGLVLSVETEAGQDVKKGQPLLVLEAMKMENVLKAESDATVKSINVEKSQAVEKGQVLIEFEA